MNVYRLGKGPAARMAARELAKYLKAISGKAVEVTKASAYLPGEKGVWVGPAEAFGPAVPNKIARRGEGFDDAVYVRAARGHALVAGANERSILLAAYRYLEEIGCRWLRPGRNGERIPSLKNPLSRKVELAEVPSAKHRAICIEGSVSREHVRDMIDYSAKRGFNAYFLQFRTSYTFYDRWYGLESKRGGGVWEHIEPDRAADLCEAAKREAVKRGMALHTVGHGWTCEPFGIPGNEWASFEGDIPAATRRHFAEVDGKRELWGGVPLNTNLCYSDAKVRSIMAGAVADYAESHPAEEVIHVWLADGVNNNCECAECSKARPSDFYVMALNEIDAILTERGLATKIVFLAYVDLLWAPETETIANPDRFILMFAPITRSYAAAFLDKPDGPPEAMLPYERNRLEFPKSPDVNLKMLDIWRESFAGECVDFDYHLMWAHHHDPGQMAMARVLHKDVRDLKKLGMDGFISCQIQRAAFPTGIWLHLIGKTLWNARTPFARTVEDYFCDVFGRRGPDVKDYLTVMSRLFAPPVLRGEVTDDAARAKAVRSMAKVAAHVDAFRRTIDRGCDSEDPVTAANWELLREHAWYAKGCAEVYGKMLAGDATAADAYSDLNAKLTARLPRIHHVLDTWLARSVMQRSLWQAGIEFEHYVD